MSSSLYREEALQHAGQQHLGEPGVNAMKPLLLIAAGLASAVVLVLGLVSVTEFARKLPAHGQIDTATLNTLVASNFGHLSELRVQEGDQVAAGDLLGEVRFSPDTPEGSHEIHTQLAQLDRLVDIAATALANREHHTETRDRQLKQMSDLTRRDIELQNNRISQLEIQSKRMQRLAEAGYLSSLDELRFRQSLISEQQSLNGLKQKLAGYLDQRLAMRQSVDELRQQTSRQLADIELKRSELRQLQQDRLNQRRQSLVATTAGRIARIEIASGTAVVPGQTILHIEQKAAALTGSILLPSSAMSGIKAGQTLWLMFDAYPEDRWGRIPAKITYLRSPGQRDDHAMFVARVALQTDQAGTLGDMNLMPGMTFSTHVVIESRSVLAWLLRPLKSLGDSL